MQKRLEISSTQFVAMHRRVTYTSIIITTWKPQCSVYGCWTVASPQHFHFSISCVCLSLSDGSLPGGAVAEWVRALACTGDRTVLAGFESHCGKLRFGTLAISFTPLCQCLSEETLKAVGPFYLVSMPGEVKDPTSTHWNV